MRSQKNTTPYSHMASMDYCCICGEYDNGYRDGKDGNFICSVCYNSIPTYVRLCQDVRYINMWIKKNENRRST